MGLLISKANDKNQSIVTINNLGIYYQELRLGDRPLSPRVKIGKLAIVDSSVMAEYDEVYQLETLICDRSTLETQVKAAKDLLAMPDETTESDRIIALRSEISALETELAAMNHELAMNNELTLSENIKVHKTVIADKKKQLKAIPQTSLKAQRQANYDALVHKLRAVQDAIASNPIHALQSFDAKSMQGIDALIDKARARHQQARFKGEFIGFTHYPTREYFYEQQAREVLKRHNEALANKGVEDGWIDFDTAMAIVCRRLAKSDEIKKQTNAANPLMKKSKAKA